MKKKTMDELGRLSPSAFRESEKLPVSIALDNVRSAYNVGSCFRTGDAFRINSILLGGFTAVPPHREIQKTALGSTESVDWQHHQNLADELEKIRSDETQVVAVEQVKGSLGLDRFIPEQGTDYVFVFGNEAFGVQDEVLEVCDRCIEIPQFGYKHSLNIAVSVGIILWDFFSKTRSWLELK